MSTALEVSFPGGKRVDVRVGQHVVISDQPVEAGGEDAAPGGFDLFLASIASCAGIYALGFCQARSLSTEGLGVALRYETNPETKLPSKFHLDLTLPPGFPEQYRAAIVRSVENCKVKKTIAAQPAFEVHVEEGKG